MSPVTTIRMGTRTVPARVGLVRVPMDITPIMVQIGARILAEVTPTELTKKEITGIMIIRLEAITIPERENPATAKVLPGRAIDFSSFPSFQKLAPIPS